MRLEAVLNRNRGAATRARQATADARGETRRPAAVSFEPRVRWTTRLRPEPFQADGPVAAPSVLVVDDDPGVRELLVELLERDARLRVAGEARDGADAVEAVARLKPDAIILDHQMPGLTGLQVLPALRRQAPNAVVVMLSGTPNPQLARLATEAGADAYFQKGTRLFDLLDTIVAFLRPADGAAPAL
jgi:CheY-like chemotaxis protein